MDAATHSASKQAHKSALKSKLKLKSQKTQVPSTEVPSTEVPLFKPNTSNTSQKTLSKALSKEMEQTKEQQQLKDQKMKEQQLRLTRIQGKAQNALDLLKMACSKFHPQHVQQLHAEVMDFTGLIQQKDNFNESNVFCFGDVPCETSRLLSNMAFIKEGIPYTVDGTTKLFDTAQHLFEFLLHGIPDQVDMWARGGCMSCYVNVFGEEKGQKMKESEWKDFLGIIPFILVKPRNEALRASLGLELRPQASSTSSCLSSTKKVAFSAPQAASRSRCMHQYMLWRPVLMAKFNGVPRLKELLLSTRGKYLLDKEDPKKVKSREADAAALARKQQSLGGDGHTNNEEVTLHDEANAMMDELEGGCILYAMPKKANNPDYAEQLKAYEAAKQEGRRTHGKLIGKNRAGRFLMSIRSEIAMTQTVQTKLSKPCLHSEVAGKVPAVAADNVPAAGVGKKRKATEEIM